MEKSKFKRTVQEFPFLEEIFTEQHLAADSISNIGVKVGDRNLVQMTPHTWSRGVQGAGEHSGHRLFWCVTAEKKCVPLEHSWHRVQTPCRDDRWTADRIDFQVRRLDCKVDYLVEIHEEHWDYELESDVERPTSDVTVYKMENFNWSRYWVSGLN